MAQEGLVGFFDVLGYQDIIDNNEIEDVSKIISEVFLHLPDNVRNKMASFIKEGGYREAFLIDLKKIEAKLISDSILLVSQAPAENKMASKIVHYIEFISYTALLLRTAFDKGIPLRGAIDYGNFYLEGQCFAGKPIINCYRLSHKLQFSGCALTSKFSDHLDSHRNKARNNDVIFLSQFIFPYLAPFKNGEAERLSLVNWLHPTNDWPKTPTDIRQYVVQAFHSHNKDIPQQVLPKLENTEIILRYSVSKDT